jgi:hypothetical protein
VVGGLGHCAPLLHRHHFVFIRDDVYKGQAVAVFLLFCFVLQTICRPFKRIQDNFYETTGLLALTALAGLQSGLMSESVLPETHKFLVSIIIFAYTAVW